MRRNILLQVGLVAAIAAGFRVDATDGLRLTGAGPADAKDYYTKKRVNGRWINGRFPKRSAARTSSPEQDTGGAPRAPASRTATVPVRAAPAGASTAPISVIGSGRSRRCRGGGIGGRAPRQAASGPAGPRQCADHRQRRADRGAASGAGAALGLPRFPVRHQDDAVLRRNDGSRALRRSSPEVSRGAAALGLDASR